MKPEYQTCPRCYGDGVILGTRWQNNVLFHNSTCNVCSGKGIISRPVEYVNIYDLEHDRFAWSLKTFPEATPLSSLNHLKSEIREIQESIEDGKPDVKEFADAQMLLFDAAGRCGIGVQDIFDAFREKLEENKARTWEQNEDGFYGHVKN